MRHYSLRSPLGRVCLLALILVMGLALGQSPARAAAPNAKELSASYRFIDQAFSHLQREALDQHTVLELVNASLDGMVMYIEKEKLNASFIKHAPDGCTDKEAREYLRKMLVQTATKYPKLYEKQKLVMEAVKGAMHIYDPYTAYLDPDAYKILQDSMSGGNFGGIGVVVGIAKDSKQLTVIEPMPNTPASRAGLRAEDRIMKIAGKSTKGMAVVDASKMMRGEPGTTVVLTIQRGTDTNTFDVPLVREKIHVDTATGEVIEANGHKIGYISLGIFGESTNRDVESLLRDFDKKQVEGYVLDVRNNSGGYVTAAIDVCSKFVSPGQRIVSIHEKGKEPSVRTSRPTGVRRTKPLVVCINEYSASASEITAGAMKDLERATLVGTKSFGKGSVQNVFPIRFPDKESSAFKITIAHYHTPSGHDIHQTGITPDVVVKLPEKPDKNAKYDPQKQAAIDEVIKKIEAESTVTQSEGTGALVVADGLMQERAHISKQLQDADFTVVSDTIERQGDTLTETIVVQTLDGKSHTFRFDVSKVLSL